MQGHTLFVYIHHRFSIFLEITTFLEKGAGRSSPPVPPLAPL